MADLSRLLVILDMATGVGCILTKRRLDFNQHLAMTLAQSGGGAARSPPSCRFAMYASGELESESNTYTTT